MHAVIVTRKEFWIFKTMPSLALKAAGSFQRKTKYQYGMDENKLALQHPVPSTKISVSSFTSVAISDEYLAIAAKDKLLVFLVSGKLAGRWLVCDEIQNGKFHALAFSNDGSQLVAVLSSTQQDTGSFDAARIFRTSEFSVALTSDRPEVTLGKDLLHKVDLRWQRDYTFVPRRLSFSCKGDLIAIATNHSRGEAQIKILKKEPNKAEWVFWGARPIIIHDIDLPHEMCGQGVTGITL
jgi:hypothetical protein